jgi:predicted neuraminidase
MTTITKSITHLFTAQATLFIAQAIWVLVTLLSTQSIAQDPMYREELVFPLHPEHNHAPSIVQLSDGSMLASWYRGSGERKADDVAVFGARLAPNSQQWSEPFLLVDTPGFPDGNTAMWIDPKGRLHLFWPLVLANTWESCITQQLIAENPLGDSKPNWIKQQSLWLKPEDFSNDANAKLDRFLAAIPAIPTDLQKEIAEVRTRLSDKLFQRLGWQTRCKPTLLKSGRVLLPLYTDTYSFSLMAISDDMGNTWRASKPLIGFGNIQPSVLQRRDGGLVAFMRENGLTQHIRICESLDDGETWGEVTSSPLPNPGSGVDAVTLPNGHWVLIYNDTVKGRNKLAVSLSTDEGKTWNATRHLEDHSSGSYHYPAIIVDADGNLHAIYSYFVEGGKSMKHAVFNEAWINKPTSP